MNKAFAENFAQEWVNAWNAHDLEDILSHYTDDFEMSSPVISQVMGEASGTLKGKSIIADYWRKALVRSPDLHFELSQVLVGANSVAIVYQGVRGLSNEIFIFNAEGKVSQAFAHYAAV